MAIAFTMTRISRFRYLAFNEPLGCRRQPTDHGAHRGDLVWVSFAKLTTVMAPTQR